MNGIFNRKTVFLVSKIQHLDLAKTSNCKILLSPISKVRLVGHPLEVIVKGDAVNISPTEIPCKNSEWK